MKTTQHLVGSSSSSLDIKPFGGPARVFWITISNNGTSSTAGEVELREAVNPAADTGTLRWSARWASPSTNAVAHYEFSGGSEEGIAFANGLRLAIDTATNLIVTVGWEG